MIIFLTARGLFFLASDGLSNEIRKELFTDGRQPQTTPCAGYIIVNLHIVLYDTIKEGHAIVYCSISCCLLNLCLYWFGFVLRTHVLARLNELCDCSCKQSYSVSHFPSTNLGNIVNVFLFVLVHFHSFLITQGGLLARGCLRDPGIVPGDRLQRDGASHSMPNTLAQSHEYLRSHT